MYDWCVVEFWVCVDWCKGWFWIVLVEFDEVVVGIDIDVDVDEWCDVVCEYVVCCDD